MTEWAVCFYAIFPMYKYLVIKRKLDELSTQKFRSSLFKGLRVSRAEPLVGFGAKPQHILQRECVVAGGEGGNTGASHFENTERCQLVKQAVNLSRCAGSPEGQGMIP